ncbi:MAG TPA: long-chain fatty acid--CoA ligase [Candidatus Anoxymicrobiaceae bacterium]
MNVGEWTTVRAALNPDDPFVACDDGREYNNLEFNKRVNRVANALPSVGIALGERIAALLPNNPEFLELLFATSKIGAIMVPLNYRLGPAELAYMLEDSGATVLVYAPEFAEHVAALKELAGGVRYRIAVGGGNEGDLDYDEWVNSHLDVEPNVAPDVTLDDPHLIMYTAGTTGRPKGAVLTHGNTQWNAINALLTYNLCRKDTALVAAPLCHIGGLSVAATPTIYSGARVVLTRFFVPDQALEAIARYSVTTMFGIPDMFILMSASEHFDTADFSSIRVMLAGDAACPVPLIETYVKRGVFFSQGYGLAEASPAVSALPEGDALRKRGSAGKPLFHVKVAIFDEDDNELPHGDMGEIVLKGENVFKEYWNMPAETAKALRNGWFHTGDMGRFDEDGYLWIVDRKKDVIIADGENVYPVDIEDVIIGHPKVLDVGVVGTHDQEFGEAPMALVVLIPGQELEVEELMAWTRERLPDNKTPKEIVFVPELPRSPTGKMLKKDLRAQYIKGDKR